MNALAVTTKEPERIVCKDKAEWLERRKSMLTASEAAIVIGASPWGSPLELYARKLGLMPEIEDNAKLRAGRMLQRGIADLYANDTGREIIDEPGEWTLTVHPEIPWLAASLDYRQLDKEKGRGVLEIKNTEDAAGWLEEPPLHVQVQVQHQLLVTGLPYGTAAALIRGWRPVHADIERSERFLVVLVEKLEKFRWHLQKKQPPEVDGREATAKALAALYPADNGLSVVLPDEALQVTAELEQIAGQKKAIEEQEDLRKNWLRARIGEASIGLLPDGRAWSYRWSERAGYTVEPSRSRSLRRLGGTKGRK